MKNKKNILITLLVFVLLVLPFAAVMEASGVTNFASLTLSGDLIVGDDATVSDDLTVSGDESVAGTLDVTGATTGAALTLTGIATLPVGTEHVGVPSVITASVAYTPATGTVATVADGEIWLVHNVFVATGTNFDCTGDNCTLTVGDGNDADGFIAAADASIQAAFTEATGYAAGYYGIENGSGGAYTLDDGGPFVYAPSGGAETIDYAVGGTDPAAGAATVYVVYTRIQ